MIRSPYDREFEREQEIEHEAYQRGVNNILDKVRAEIERLHYHPKLDFIKNDEVVEMALDIIDKIQGIKEI